MVFVSPYKITAMGLSEFHLVAVGLKKFRTPAAYTNILSTE